MEKEKLTEPQTDVSVKTFNSSEKNEFMIDKKEHFFGEKGKVFKAIASIMKRVGPVGKDSKNVQQGYKFRGIDAVMNELNVFMGEEGLFIVPNIIKKETSERKSTKGGTIFTTELEIEYRIMSDDGSYIRTTIVGEAMDNGDKSVYKAMSMALKYLLVEIFMIPTLEKKDGDEDSYDVTPLSGDFIEKINKCKTIEDLKSVRSEINKVKSKISKEDMDAISIAYIKKEPTLEKETENQK